MTYSRALELAKEEAANPRVNCCGCWDLSEALLAAEELLVDAEINQKHLLNYRQGNYPYDFSKIPEDQRDNEAFDALMKIDSGMAEWLARRKEMVGE